MPKPTGRAGGRIPEWAANQTRLGAYLMPPRDRKIIQRAAKLEGNPGRGPEGYNVVLWQEFVNKNFSANVSSSQPDKLRLQNEKLQIEIDRLTFDLQVRQKEYSKNTDIEIWVGDLVMQAKRVLLGIPSKLAPIVVGLTEVEAELAMKEEINAALTQLTSRPLNGEAAPQAAPAEPPAAESDPAGSVPVTIATPPPAA